MANRNVKREFLIDKVLIAIKSVWPADDIGQTIHIQQDNARPHILPNDNEFALTVSKTSL
jgi:hypothetical protein